jgi:hypothetical protein
VDGQFWMVENGILSHNFNVELGYDEKDFQIQMIIHCKLRRNNNCSSSAEEIGKTGSASLSGNCVRSRVAIANGLTGIKTCFFLNAYSCFSKGLMKKRLIPAHLTN